MLGRSLLLECFYEVLVKTNTLVTKGAIYCENNFALSLRVTYLYDGTIIFSLEMNSKNHLAWDLEVQIPRTTEQCSSISTEQEFCSYTHTESNSKMKVVYKGQISNKSFFFILLLQISLEYPPCVGYSERFLGKIEEFQISE